MTDGELLKLKVTSEKPCHFRVALSRGERTNKARAVVFIRPAFSAALLMEEGGRAGGREEEEEAGDGRQKCQGMIHRVCL